MLFMGVSDPYEIHVYLPVNNYTKFNHMQEWSQMVIKKSFFHCLFFLPILFRYLYERINSHNMC